MHPDSEQIIQYHFVGNIKNKFKMGIKQENTSNQGTSSHKKKLKTSEEDEARSSKPPNDPVAVNNPTSMSSLILWNISKALELNPDMDLKHALTEAQQGLENETRDLNAVLAKLPEQQHLVCAVLAWHQLGHNDAEALFKFIESKKNEVSNQCDVDCKPHNADKPTSTQGQGCCQGPSLIKCGNSGSFGSHTSGPILKLPVETKVIMRFDNAAPRPTIPREQCCREKDPIMSKIDEACCYDTACVERLAALDATTKELRVRASKLARREAERVELLERAESAWKDLELGYQRRLNLAEEKEDDINKQIEKLISERNDYKKAFNTLSQQLRDRGDAAEQLKAKLTEVEKEMCERACVKLRLSEECARGEAILAEQQCRAAQLDRDLLFKEEQGRRKLVTIENEAESARALSHEAERALRAELSGLREQIGQVSAELLREDEENVRVKTEHDLLRQQKLNLIEDLDGCKLMCDRKMQGVVNELNRKREELASLKEKVMECRCKIPVNATVEVKRTPSLAALCRCTPEDKLLASCSCTSLRGRLLTNLLADLFGGLQAELSGSGAQMPCQLLKCLEDKHNWDRASVVKTNLRNFFSKLLMGELDIAIATSIENYHAKWIGKSCADIAKMKPEPDDDLSHGWQQRALEKKAQKMATKLAEKLFEERAEQLVQRAKDIVTSGPPPCQCQPPTQSKAGAAVFPCLMQPVKPFDCPVVISDQTSNETPAYWKRTIQDVTQLRLQIEDLKKESIKKEDLKLMEDKITKIVKQVSGTENEDIPTVSRDVSNFREASTKKETKIMRTPDENIKTMNQNKIVVPKKKQIDVNSISKKTSPNVRPNKQTKKAAHGQSYAVNLCLCGGPQKNSKHLQNANSDGGTKPTWRQKSSRDIIPQSSSIRQTKPINIKLTTSDIDENVSKSSAQVSCHSNCKCFNKVPSNTSIDKLLETLTKWKCDLANPNENCIKNVKSSFNKYSKNTMKGSMRIGNQNESKIDLSVSEVSQKGQVTESDIYNNMHKEIGKNTQPAHLKQVVPTESEYMGAVNLDKSNEKTCKCINTIEKLLENDPENAYSGQNCIPFQCLHASTCECKIYQDMQKEFKRSQTDKSTKLELLNQLQGSIPSKCNPDLDKMLYSKTSPFLNKQTEIEQRSDISNVKKETELFSRNCDYYIKFLGVTLGDINTQKTKKKVNNADHNIEALFHSKDKNFERKKKHLKKMSEVESSDAYTKPVNCQCHAKFDELKNFVNNIFTNQIQNNCILHKDESIDPPSFKYAEHTVESCVCCKNITGDDSKDLELNAFHLLEDHLREKLEEFKSYSCKSSCIPPEEEEKLFSAILQRVKQAISDCANEMKCCCPGSLSKDGSWSRAYGLLQEYLKIKIKRVQCLCVLNENNEKAMLPEMLEKVCNLIENDFQRLKDICKCKNNNETHKMNIRIDNLLQAQKELPEKDTNVTKTKYTLFEIPKVVYKKPSKQISNKSIILTENISSQVPHNFGKDTKSCDVTSLCNKDAKTTETDIIVTDSKSNGVAYNTCDFNCCFQLVQEEESTQFSEICVTKEVLVNLYANSVIDADVNLHNLPRTVVDQGQSQCLSVNRFEGKKTLPGKEISANSPDVENKVLNEQPQKEANVPYIGYTVDCTCNQSLGHCVCTKGVVLANNDKIDSIWKEVVSSYKNGKKDFSYIMTGPQKKDKDNFNHGHVKADGKCINIIPETSIQLISRTCETDANDINRDELVLKNSLIDNHHISTIHHTTSTFEENGSLETSCSNSELSPLDWFECPAPINTDDKPNTDKLTNSICYSMPTNTSSDIMKSYQSCDCDKVPLCHVKMLVENIEKNLIESKCTCDSLISNVCPVHSKKHC